MGQVWSWSPPSTETSAHPQCRNICQGFSQFSANETWFWLTGTPSPSPLRTSHRKPVWSVSAAAAQKHFAICCALPAELLRLFLGTGAFFQPCLLLPSSAHLSRMMSREVQTCWDLFFSPWGPEECALLALSRCGAHGPSPRISPLVALSHLPEEIQLFSKERGLPLWNWSNINQSVDGDFQNSYLDKLTTPFCPIQGCESSLLLSVAFHLLFHLLGALHLSKDHLKSCQRAMKWISSCSRFQDFYQWHQRPSGKSSSSHISSQNTHIPNTSFLCGKTQSSPPGSMEL